jgi:hypothetical protein
MKRFIGFVLLVALLMVGGFLNPGIEDHQEAIQSNGRNDGQWSLRDFSAMLKASSTQYNNYILFSTCTIRGHRVSTGYLGRIDVHPVDWIDILGFKDE